MRGTAPSRKQEAWPGPHPRTCCCGMLTLPYPMLTQRLPRAAVAAMVVGFFGVVAGARRAAMPCTGPWLRRVSDAELYGLPVRPERADRHQTEDMREHACLWLPTWARCAGTYAAEGPVTPPRGCKTPHGLQVIRST